VEIQGRRRPSRLQCGPKAFEFRGKDEGIERSVHLFDILENPGKALPPVDQVAPRGLLTLRGMRRHPPAIAVLRDAGRAPMAALQSVPLPFFRDKNADAAKQELVFSHTPILARDASLLRRSQWKDLHALGDAARQRQERRRPQDLARRPHADDEAVARDGEFLRAPVHRLHRMGLVDADAVRRRRHRGNATKVETDEHEAKALANARRSSRADAERLVQREFERQRQR